MLSTKTLDLFKFGGSHAFRWESSETGELPWCLEQSVYEPGL